MVHRRQLIVSLQRMADKTTDEKTREELLYLIEQLKEGYSK